MLSMLGSAFFFAEMSVCYLIANLYVDEQALGFCFNPPEKQNA